jgi:hypothetical protein
LSARKISSKDLFVDFTSPRALAEILAQSAIHDLEAIQIGFWSMIRELQGNSRRVEVTCFFEELPLPFKTNIVHRAKMNHITMIGVDAHQVIAL